MKRLFLIVFFPLIALAQKDNVVRLEGIQIQGNSEEPKVIFITPWREPPGTGRLYDGATQFQDQWLYSLDKDRLDFEVKMLDTYKRAEPKP
ncbi:MAG: hypothetical protein RL217_2143 [Pseudomonadota bacterium]|jgi:hypothetical protein